MINKTFLAQHSSIKSFFTTIYGIELNLEFG